MDSNVQSDLDFERLQPIVQSPAIAEALANGDITKGHAALLTVLPDLAQHTALKELLRMGDAMPGVDALRRLIESEAKPLEDACFDITSCLRCRYNSDVHALEFSPAISRGLCVNAACYERLEEDAIQERMAPLRGNPKYRVIKIVAAKAQDDWTTIKADGDEGVGQQQMAECLNECPRYGAVVRRGRFKPTPETDVCTDMGCHARKVEDNVKRMQDAVRDDLWRHVLHEHVRQMSRAKKHVAVMAALAVGAGSSLQWRPKFGLRPDESLSAYMDRVAAMSQEDRMQSQGEFEDALLANVPAAHLSAMLQALGVRMVDHWRLRPGILMSMTAPQLRTMAADLQLNDIDVDAVLQGGRTALAKAIGERLDASHSATYIPHFLRF